MFSYPIQTGMMETGDEHLLLKTKCMDHFTNLGFHSVCSLFAFNRFGFDFQVEQDFS